MVALSAPLLAVPFLAATLTRWFSPAALSSIGLLIAGGGLFWLAQFTPGTADYRIVLPMLVIGCGTGLPWGLMDGLSLSVVPKERAGMATGIFSTTRVAGEGIALAIVSALLSEFTRYSLIHTSLKADSGTADKIGDAAQHIVAGNLPLRHRVATQLR